MRRATFLAGSSTRSPTTRASLSMAAFAGPCEDGAQIAEEPAARAIRELSESFGVPDAGRGGPDDADGVLDAIPGELIGVMWARFGVLNRSSPSSWSGLAATTAARAGAGKTIGAAAGASCDGLGDDTDASLNASSSGLPDAEAAGPACAGPPSSWTLLRATFLAGSSTRSPVLRACGGCSFR